MAGDEGWRTGVLFSKAVLGENVNDEGWRTSVLFRCGVLGMNSCARPRYTEPF